MSYVGSLLSMFERTVVYNFAIWLTGHKALEIAKSTGSASLSVVTLSGTVCEYKFLQWWLSRRH